MTDITITTTATYIKAEPGVSEKDIIKSYRSLRTMESVILFTGPKGTYVEVRFSGGAHWTLDVSEVRGSSVTLNTVTPLTNEALCDSLAGLVV